MERQRVGRFEFAPHNCFACGRLNLGGLQLALHAAGGRCWTDLTLARRFEGWQDMAHGGVVTAILDEVMAWSLIDQDRLGFTARMEVRFHHPVEVERPIRAEGWVTAVQRRKFQTAAHLVDTASGRVLAEATAVYLAAPAATEQRLRERYEIREVQAVG